VLVGIFGAGRNGSTLLMRLLDGSDGLWIYPVELNYLSGFTPKSWKDSARRRIGSLVPGRYERKFHHWAATHLRELKEFYLDKLEEPLQVNGDALEAVKRRTGRSLQADLENFLEALHTAYDDRQLPVKPALMFKTIDVPHLDDYHAMFPTLKFVHIVRHPYSNYASLKRTDMVLKQKPFWFQGGDILRLQIESRWIPHARFLLKWLQQDPSRHFVVRYEDLCESPEQTVAGICRWLGVPAPANPSEQTVLGGRRTKELPINSSQKGVKTPTRVVADMSKEFGYDDILTGRERELIRLRTYDLARRLGYFNSGEESVLPSRLKLLGQWIVPDRWEHMNSHPGLRRARAILRRRLYVFTRVLTRSAS
jgi:hypothetical protein